MDKRLQQLREEYKNVQIPKELDIIVEKALQQEPKKKRIVMWPTSAAIAAAILFTALVNINPDAAQAMSKIPVIGKIVKAITFIEIKEEKDQSSIDVKTPALSGLSNKELENSINEKYLKESQQLYKEFIQSTSKNKKGISASTVITRRSQTRQIYSLSGAILKQHKHLPTHKAVILQLTKRMIFYLH